MRIKTGILKTQLLEHKRTNIQRRKKEQSYNTRVTKKKKNKKGKNQLDKQKCYKQKNWREDTRKESLWGIWGWLREMRLGENGVGAVQKTRRTR